MKPTLPTYFVHIRYGHLSVTKKFIFSLKLLRQISFLLCPGRSSHILEVPLFALKIFVARVF